MKDMLKDYYRSLNVDEKVFEYCNSVEEKLKDRFAAIDAVSELNQLKVLKAMQDNRLSEAHFAGSSGYGYTDDGRDALERIYADVFHTEDALVRTQIVCGTHALCTAMFGNLRPGDEILAIAGKPYDTLDEIIGIRESRGSLAEYGVTYAQVDLLPNGDFDIDGIKNAINSRTRLVEIQRSKGYAVRKTLSVQQIGEAIKAVKSVNPDIICMVDNCYGEFVQDIEPSDVGAPGLGKEVGASLGNTKALTQGLFMAPTVTASALKGAIFAANVYEGLGFKAVPDSTEDRYDIIQAVELQTPERVLAFCEGIQAAAPVDSYVRPEPWDMPGYDSPVIMAAGAFVSGSSIELSADAPMRSPYAVYFQGGLTYPHAKYGIIMSLQKMVEKNLIVW